MYLCICIFCKLSFLCLCLKVFSNKHGRLNVTWAEKNNVCSDQLRVGGDVPSSGPPAACCLCRGEEQFQFSPKFPPHLNSLAERLGMCSQELYPCFFCRPRALDLEPDPVAHNTPRIKKEPASRTDFLENATDSSRWFGYTAEDIHSVSRHSASLLILHHGYPPNIAIKALLEHRTNILEAVKAAERLLVQRVEHLQMRMLQNVSHEHHGHENARREANVEAQLIQGDLTELANVYPDFYSTVLTQSALMLVYLLSGEERSCATSDDVSLPCFCGQDDSTGPRAQNTSSSAESTFHMTTSTASRLLQLVAKSAGQRRLEVFHLLSLLRKAEKWYKEPAVHFSSRLRTQWCSRLHFLDACIQRHELSVRIPDILLDWEDLVDNAGVCYLARVRATVAAIILFRSWLRHQFETIQEGLYTPNFQNLLALPALFSAKIVEKAGVRPENGSADAVGGDTDDSVKRNSNSKNTAETLSLSAQSLTSYKTDNLPVHHQFIPSLRLCCSNFLSVILVDKDVWSIQDDSFWNPVSLPPESSSANVSGHPVTDTKACAGDTFEVNVEELNADSGSVPILVDLASPDNSS